MAAGLFKLINRREFIMTKHQEVKQGVIFPIGEKNEAYAQYFIGQSYLNRWLLMQQSMWESRM